MTRIAIVVSHPIQHFCPQYASWSKLPNVEVRVFFASKHGLTPYKDANFNAVVQWENLSLGFPHEFLPGADQRQLGKGIDCPQLGEHLSQYSPDAVIVYGYAQKLQRRTLSWASSHSKRVLMIADSELRSHRPWIVRCVKAIVLPTLLAKIDRFLTVGDANEAYYRRYGVPDSKLIRAFFPIDVAAFDSALERRSEGRRRFRSKLGLSEAQRVVLMVGKFVPWKRQRDLVAFANAVRTKAEGITVVLAGSGPEEDALRRSTELSGEGGVVFAGFVPPRDLPDLYSASDAYVHCSEHEPHSLAISEAIYTGLPVVISDLCGSYGPSDDVRVGLNGFVYPCGDITALSSQLLKLLLSPELARKMGEASSRIARANQALAHGGALVQALESF